MRHRQISFNSEYIAVRMNVSALDRLVLFDRSPVNNGSDLTDLPGWKHLAWLWLCHMEAKDHYNSKMVVLNNMVTGKSIN